MNKVYVESMVIYPPEERFAYTRKYTTPYETSQEKAPTECFKLDYWHHAWVSSTPIIVGEKCICGKETKE